MTSSATGWFDACCLWSPHSFFVAFVKLTSSDLKLISPKFITILSSSSFRSSLLVRLRNNQHARTHTRMHTHDVLSFNVKMRLILRMHSSLVSVNLA